MRDSYLDFRARLKAPITDHSPEQYLPEQYLTVQGEMHVAHFGESNDAYRSLRGKEVVGLEYHDPTLLEALLEGLVLIASEITPSFPSNTYYRLFERRAERVNERFNNENMDLLWYEYVNELVDYSVYGFDGFDNADWHEITLMNRRSYYLPTLRDFAIDHVASFGNTGHYPNKTIKNPEESAKSVDLYKAVLAYHGGDPESLEPLQVKKVVNIEEKPPWLMTLATYVGGLAMAGALMSFSPARGLLRRAVRNFFGKTRSLRFTHFLDSLPDHLAARATNPVSWPRLIRQRNRSFSQWVSTPKSQLCGSLATLGELYIGLCIFSVIHTDYLTVTLRNQKMAESAAKMVRQNGAQDNLILVGAMHMGIVDLLIEKYGYEIVRES